MTKRGRLACGAVLTGLLLSLACEKTFHTGRVGNTRNPPSADGACFAGLTPCGAGAFAQCLDLQTDRAHCGTCDNACLPGIACQAGACQQVACTGTVTISTQAVSDGAPNAPSLAILADVNGDGHPDLVSWGTMGPNLTSMFQVALGQAGGGFAAPAIYPTASKPRSIVAKDPNGDGIDDLYVVDWDETLTGIDSCRLEIWLGHSDGKLTLGSRSKEIVGCENTTVADLNGDGQPDLVAEIANASEPTVFFADANGELHDGALGCAGQLVWDWNGDGLPDLVGLFPTLGLCLNKGNGTFGELVDCGILTRSIAGGRELAAIADFNRDGHPDLAMGIDNSVDVLLGMGGCQFQPMAEYPLTDSVRLLASADVDGDGLPDLVASTEDDTVFLLQNGPPGIFQAMPLAAGDISRRTGGSLLVGDVTGDGKADVVLVAGHGIGQAVVEDGQITSVPGQAGSTVVVANTCR